MTSVKETIKPQKDSASNLLTAQVGIAKNFNEFWALVFTKEDWEQMPETDINFAAEMESILKKLRIVPEEVT